MAGTPSQAWHNASTPADVNGDALVTPLDALLVINALNTNVSLPPGELPTGLPPNAAYWDVSGDGSLSPLDALLVMNHLNRPPAEPTKTIPGGVPSWAGAAQIWDQPPANLPAVAAWMNGVQDADNPTPGKIEVDWIRVHAISSTGVDTVISLVQYDNARVEGGLFSRYPWFGNNTSTPMPVEFAGGTLVLDVSTHPDKVWHWWSFPRVYVPSGTVRIWTEARVRVSGGAAVEVGNDYFQNLTNVNYIPNVTHAEGARGRWAFASPDWQIITAGKP